jgi:hypothetical protein
MVNYATNLVVSEFFLSAIDAFVKLFPNDVPAAAGDKGVSVFGFVIVCVCSCVRVGGVRVCACLRSRVRVRV